GTGRSARKSHLTRVVGLFRWRYWLPGGRQAEGRPFLAHDSCRRAWGAHRYRSGPSRLVTGGGSLCAPHLPIRERLCGKRAAAARGNQRGGGFTKRIALIIAVGMYFPIAVISAADCQRTEVWRLKNSASSSEAVRA